MKKAVVLWTGGKDSALALLESLDIYSIDRLVTFVPEFETEFLAHPVKLMKIQAESMGLRHQCMTIREPYDESYKNAIAQLKHDQIETLITGDISTVGNQPNWIKQCSHGILNTHMPLWDTNRKELLEKIEINQLDVVCSLSYKQYFKRTITGKHFDLSLINHLLKLEETTGIDPCGENGEYHTCVLSAPFFRYKIKLLDVKINEMDEFFYLDYSEFEKILNNRKLIDISLA